MKSEKAMPSCAGSSDLCLRCAAEEIKHIFAEQVRSSTSEVERPPAPVPLAGFCCLGPGELRTETAFHATEVAVEYKCPAPQKPLQKLRCR